MKCECGNRLNSWDTFCCVCGMYINKSTHTTSHLTSNEKDVRDFSAIDSLNSNPVFFPNPINDVVCLFADLGEYLLLVGHTSVVFHTPTSNKIWKTIEVAALYPEFTGYLRPYLLLAGDTFVKAYHIGQDDSQPRIVIEGQQVTTAPVAYDRGAQKRAFYGLKSGLLVVDCCQEGSTKFQCVRGEIVELDLFENEKVRQPVLLEDDLVVMTSVGRFLRLNARASIRDLRERAVLQGAPLADGVEAGVPVAVGNSVYFEGTRCTDAGLLTVSFYGLNTFRSSQNHQEIARSAEIKYLMAQWHANEMRAKHAPIVLNGGRTLVASAPDYKGLFWATEEGGIWESYSADTSNFKSSVYHWNCLPFNTNRLLLVDMEKGRMRSFDIDRKSFAGSELAIPTNDAPMLAPPICCRRNGQCILYVLTARRIYLFCEK